MNPCKSPIGGHQITRKVALKGLGDPKKWKKESDAVYAEFQAKPKSTLLQRAANAIKKTLAAKSKPHLEPVYAKKMKRRAAAKHRKRKLRNR